MAGDQLTENIYGRKFNRKRYLGSHGKNSQVMENKFKNKNKYNNIYKIKMENKQD
jgi:hypothetical protein